jgi:hypothetical protein
VLSEISASQQPANVNINSFIIRHSFFLSFLPSVVLLLHSLLTTVFARRSLLQLARYCSLQHLLLL